MTSGGTSRSHDEALTSHDSYYSLGVKFSFGKGSLIEPLPHQNWHSSGRVIAPPTLFHV